MSDSEHIESDHSEYSRTPERSGWNPDAPSVDIEPNTERVIEAVFGIGPSKQKTYRVLRSHPWSTTEELAEVLDRDRSNVNRSLTHLVELKLAVRRRRILRNSGGYIYEYHVRLPDRIHSHLKAVFDAWSQTALKQIAEFVYGSPNASEGEAWVDQLILDVTGEITSTEEYVYHHGIEKSRRAGSPISDALSQGSWSPPLRERYVSNGSRKAVTRALNRLEDAGHIEAVEPATQDEWEGPYWRLTPDGRNP